MKCLSVFALVLVVLGAINWGLWGFFQFDLVAWLCKGNTTGMARVVYGIIGLAGLWSLKLMGRCRHLCCSSEGKGKGCCK